MKRSRLVPLLLASALLLGCEEPGNQKLNDANNLIEIGKLDEAQTLIQEVIAEYPDHAKAYNNLGFLYAARREVQAARSAYQKSIALYKAAGSSDPEELANAYGNLALLEDTQGDPEKARAAYEDAVAAGPEYLRALHNAATFYRKEHDYETALSWFDKALEIDPYFYQSRIYKASTLNDLGRHDEAVQLYSELLSEDPFSIYLLTQFAFTQLMADQLDEASQTLDNALTIHPGSLELQSAAALLLARRGDKEKAQKLASTLVEVIQKAQKEEGNKMWASALFSRHLGLLYAELGETKRARVWLEYSIGQEPAFHETQRALAALPADATEESAPAEDPAPGDPQS